VAIKGRNGDIDVVGFVGDGELQGRVKCILLWWLRIGVEVAGAVKVIVFDYKVGVDGCVGEEE